jgi:hypothetical protein
MGRYSQTVAVGVGWKDREFRSRQAHHVGGRQKEDRRRSAGKVGEGEGGEEEVAAIPAPFSRWRLLYLWLGPVVASFERECH